jgi:hypothetical protein
MNDGRRLAEMASGSITEELPFLEGIVSNATLPHARVASHTQSYDRTSVLIAIGGRLEICGDAHRQFRDCRHRSSARKLVN